MYIIVFFSMRFYAFFGFYGRFLRIFSFFLVLFCSFFSFGSSLRTVRDIFVYFGSRLRRSKSQDRGIEAKPLARCFFNQKRKKPPEGVGFSWGFVGK